MTPGLKKLLVSSVCLLVIAAAAFSIIRRHRAPAYNVELHKYIGRVMAEQTARVAGPRANITFISIPTRSEPELGTQVAAFKRTLYKLGAYNLDEEELDPKNQPKYGLGNGLSGRRFVRTVNKNLDADVIVSFIGAPELSDQEVLELKKVPRFVAEARSPDDLPKLFEKKILHVAVVSRFMFPAPGPSKPDTAEEWFHKRYQVITPEIAASCFVPE